MAARCSAPSTSSPGNGGSRFHAKGFFPFDDNIKPQINNDGGVKALEELVAASKFLYPGATSNGLFENFEAYGQGDKFTNIGWGGTQKFLNSDKSKVKGKLGLRQHARRHRQRQAGEDALLQLGLELHRRRARRRSRRSPTSTRSMPAGPEMSTIAVRDPGGYFDPIRGAQYKDPDVIKAYSAEFLVAHEASMRGSIPDLYLKGQGEYFDALRVNIQAADVGKMKPKEALDETARTWERITRRHERPQPEGAVGLPQDALSGRRPVGADLSQG